MTATETATQARTAQGFKVEISADGVTYTEIGGIPEGGLTLPDETQDFHEFVTNSSPGGIREAVPKNTGAIGSTQIKLHANPNIAVQTTLNGYYDARTKFWLKVVNPDGDLTLVQAGYVAKRVFAFAGDPQMLDVEFKPAGELKSGSTYGV